METLLSNTNPTNLIIICLAVILVAALAIFGIPFALRKFSGKLSIGDFSLDLSKKESVNAPTDKVEKQNYEARFRVEEYLRTILAKQYTQVGPFLQSLRPVFNQITYSILDDAMLEQLGKTKEIRVKKEVEDDNADYELFEVKRYVPKSSTRVFTNLVESTVDSLLRALEVEIHSMLINNNIGKTRAEVQSYLHLKVDNLVGIIRNELCDAYNGLSGKNLFDTSKYWLEVGISYPVDWIEDKLYKLFVLCLNCKYSDYVE